MPRKPARPELALTVRDGRRLEHEPDDELDDDDDDEPAACLLCTLADNNDEEPLRVRLARALVYGDLVLADGQGIATCVECHEAIASERAELARELRAAQR